ncbi:hypothetical protein [Clostridium sp.]|uniref:hypothetical protein n=1 Tax=Clostridium sp. TaxID=1506 RepID=UPI003F3364B2
MKLKKTLVLMCLFLLLGVIGVEAKIEAKPNRSPVVIGEVLEVNEDKENLMVLVDGYIKGSEVIKEKIVLIVGKETKVLNSSADKKENIEINKGDMVYARVSDAMTKSLPPQVVAKRIFVTKGVN